MKEGRGDTLLVSPTTTVTPEYPDDLLTLDRSCNLTRNYRDALVFPEQTRTEQDEAKANSPEVCKLICTYCYCTQIERLDGISGNGKSAFHLDQSFQTLTCDVSEG